MPFSHQQYLGWLMRPKPASSWNIRRTFPQPLWRFFSSPMVVLRQHRTISSASLSRLFAPLPQFQKWEIHTVFLHFRNFELEQKSYLRLLAELCGAALVLVVGFSVRKVTSMKKEFVERIEIYQTEHVCKKGSEAQNRMEMYWLLRSTTDRRQRENGIAA